MNSQRAIWVWRVAGLAVALMFGVAVRRVTSYRLSEPTHVAPSPGAGGHVAPKPAATERPPSPSNPTSPDTRHSPREPRTTDHGPPASAYETARTPTGHALERAVSNTRWPR